MQEEKKKTKKKRAPKKKKATSKDLLQVEKVVEKKEIVVEKPKIVKVNEKYWRNGSRAKFQLYVLSADVYEDFELMQEEYRRITTLYMRILDIKNNKVKVHRAFTENELKDHYYDFIDKYKDILEV